ncbi:putative Protein disabled [Hypsibius exemplaris]|uniref:PID domain-containing protein n=1 Tax=Hypsibius exemplaris TaxID=2072580 RepID=A0A9X6RKN6_HYPEX|nr:putative Protein disabled [Hypsibius exemplaris]
MAASLNLKPVSITEYPDAHLVLPGAHVGSPITRKINPNNVNSLDSYHFAGEGVQFRGKLIGIKDVDDIRGDAMCRQAMHNLKAALKLPSTKENKTRITIGVSMYGLKIKDERGTIVLHQHPVPRISFVWRDQTDPRAFGYVYGTPSSGHRFAAIKVVDATADTVVGTIQQLFQISARLRQQEQERAQTKQPEAPPPPVETVAVAPLPDTPARVAATSQQSAAPKVAAEQGPSLLSFDYDPANQRDQDHPINKISSETPWSDFEAFLLNGPDPSAQPAAQRQEVASPPANPYAGMSGAGSQFGAMPGPSNPYFRMASGPQFGGMQTYPNNPHFGMAPAGPYFGGPPAMPNQPRPQSAVPPVVSGVMDDDFFGGFGSQGNSGASSPAVVRAATPNFPGAGLSALSPPPTPSRRRPNAAGAPSLMGDMPAFGGSAANGQAAPASAAPVPSNQYSDPFIDNFFS